MFNETTTILDMHMYEKDMIVLADMMAILGASISAGLLILLAAGVVLILHCRHAKWHLRGAHIGKYCTRQDSNVSIHPLN